MLGAIEQKTDLGIEHGPLQEAGMITAGLDFYKPTMSQLAFEKEADTEVTFTFKNRGQERIADYVGVQELQDRLDQIAERGFGQEELDFFATLRDDQDQPMFGEDYLDYLATHDLPKVQVTHDAETDDIAIEATGDWPLVSFWETVVMSELNEQYFENYMITHDIDPIEVYEEGNRRLDEKIAILQANPDIKIIDFGTRRHFSLRWQKHVLQRLQDECPENLVGTSNVGLAQTTGEKPIGTFAHEMPMVYAGLAQARGLDIRESHNQFLNDWHDQYGENLSIALTDTFTTDFFFEDFTDQQAQDWKGVRHDSGDPVEFGERLIKFYEDKDIDPTEKTLVFSDGLGIDTIVALNKHFKGRVNVAFGWGTTLTNDLGLKPLNIVVKATHVKTAEGQQANTVKLSDNPGKHLGPAELVHDYQYNHFAVAA